MELINDFKAALLIDENRVFETDVRVVPRKLSLTLQPVLMHEKIKIIPSRSR
jgi:hypothetical protein